MKIMKVVRVDMETRAIVIACLLVISFSSGCSTWRKLDRTEQGAVIGVGSGALIGGAATGNAGGALLGGAAGGVAGGVIGHETDDDRRHRR